MEAATRAVGALCVRVVGGLQEQISMLRAECFALVKAHLKSRGGRATVAEVRAALHETVETCVASLTAQCERCIEAGVSARLDSALSLFSRQADNTACCYCQRIE